MNLWLDDMRTPPVEGDWLWVKDYDEAVEAMETHGFEWASLDHDLADEHYGDLAGHHEKTGYSFALWMVENNVWPTEGVGVHSWNPVGADRIRGVVDRYGPYTKPCIHTPASGMRCA